MKSSGLLDQEDIYQLQPSSCLGCDREELALHTSAPPTCPACFNVFDFIVLPGVHIYEKILCTPLIGVVHKFKPVSSENSLSRDILEVDSTETCETDCGLSRKHSEISERGRIDFQKPSWPDDLTLERPGFLRKNNQRSRSLAAQFSELSISWHTDIDTKNHQREFVGHNLAKSQKKSNHLLEKSISEPNLVVNNQVSDVNNTYEEDIFRTRSYINKPDHGEPVISLANHYSTTENHKNRDIITHKSGVRVCMDNFWDWDAEFFENLYVNYNMEEPIVPKEPESVDRTVGSEQPERECDRFYKCAFEFAKRKGYGFVEFVEDRSEGTQPKMTYLRRKPQVLSANTDDRMHPVYALISPRNKWHSRHQKCFLKPRDSFINLTEKESLFKLVKWDRSRLRHADSDVEKVRLQNPTFKLSCPDLMKDLSPQRNRNRTQLKTRSSATSFVTSNMDVESPEETREMHYDICQSSSLNDFKDSMICQCQKGKRKKLKVYEYMSTRSKSVGFGDFLSPTKEIYFKMEVDKLYSCRLKTFGSMPTKSENHKPNEFGSKLSMGRMKSREKRRTILDTHTSKKNTLASEDSIWSLMMDSSEEESEAFFENNTFLPGLRDETSPQYKLCNSISATIYRETQLAKKHLVKMEHSNKLSVANVEIVHFPYKSVHTDYDCAPSSEGVSKPDCRSRKKLKSLKCAVDSSAVCSFVKRKSHLLMDSPRGGAKCKDDRTDGIWMNLEICCPKSLFLNADCQTPKCKSPSLIKTPSAVGDSPSMGSPSKFEFTVQRSLEISPKHLNDEIEIKENELTEKLPDLSRIREIYRGVEPEGKESSYSKAQLSAKYLNEPGESPHMTTSLLGVSKSAEDSESPIKGTNLSRISSENRVANAVTNRRTANKNKSNVSSKDITDHVGECSYSKSDFGLDSSQSNSIHTDTVQIASQSCEENANNNYVTRFQHQSKTTKTTHSSCFEHRCSQISSLLHPKFEDQNTYHQLYLVFVPPRKSTSLCDDDSTHKSLTNMKVPTTGACTDKENCCKSKQMLQYYNFKRYFKADKEKHPCIRTWLKFIQSRTRSHSGITTRKLQNKLQRRVFCKSSKSRQPDGMAERTDHVLLRTAKKSENVRNVDLNSEYFDTEVIIDNPMCSFYKDTQTCRIKCGEKSEQQSSRSVQKESPRSVPQQSSKSALQQSLSAPQDSSRSAPQKSSRFAPERSSTSAPQQSSKSVPQQSSRSARQQSLRSAQLQNSRSAPHQSSIFAPQSLLSASPHILSASPGPISTPPCSLVFSIPKEHERAVNRPDNSVFKTQTYKVNNDLDFWTSTYSIQSPQTPHFANNIKPKGELHLNFEDHFKEIPAICFNTSNDENKNNSLIRNTTDDNHFPGAKRNCKKNLKNELDVTIIKEDFEILQDTDFLGSKKMRPDKRYNGSDEIQKVEIKIDMFKSCSYTIVVLGSLRVNSPGSTEEFALKDALNSEICLLDDTKAFICSKGNSGRLDIGKRDLRSSRNLPRISGLKEEKMSFQENRNFQKIRMGKSQSFLRKRNSQKIRKGKFQVSLRKGNFQKIRKGKFHVSFRKGNFQKIRNEKFQENNNSKIFQEWILYSHNYQNCRNQVKQGIIKTKEEIYSKIRGNLEKNKGLVIESSKQTGNKDLVADGKDKKRSCSSCGQRCFPFKKRKKLCFKKESVMVFACYKSTCKQSGKPRQREKKMPRKQIHRQNYSINRIYCFYTGKLYKTQAQSQDCPFHSIKEEKRSAYGTKSCFSSIYNGKYFLRNKAEQNRWKKTNRKFARAVMKRRKNVHDYCNGDICTNNNNNSRRTKRVSPYPKTKIKQSRKQWKSKTQSSAKSARDRKVLLQQRTNIITYAVGPEGHKCLYDILRKRHDGLLQVMSTSAYRFCKRYGCYSGHSVIDNMVDNFRSLITHFPERRLKTLNKILELNLINAPMNNNMSRMNSRHFISGSQNNLSEFSGKSKRSKERLVKNHGSVNHNASRSSFDSYSDAEGASGNCSLCDEMVMDDDFGEASECCSCTNCRSLNKYKEPSIHSVDSLILAKKRLSNFKNKSKNACYVETPKGSRHLQRSDISDCRNSSLIWKDAEYEQEQLMSQEGDDINFDMLASENHHRLKAKSTGALQSSKLLSGNEFSVYSTDYYSKDINWREGSNNSRKDCYDSSTEKDLRPRLSRACCHQNDESSWYNLYNSRNQLSASSQQKVLQDIMMQKRCDTSSGCKALSKSWTNLQGSFQNSSSNGNLSQRLVNPHKKTNSAHPRQPVNGGHNSSNSIVSAMASRDTTYETKQNRTLSQPFMETDSKFSLIQSFVNQYFSSFSNDTEMKCPDEGDGKSSERSRDQKEFVVSHWKLEPLPPDEHKNLSDKFAPGLRTDTGRKRTHGDNGSHIYNVYASLHSMPYLQAETKAPTNLGNYKREISTIRAIGTSKDFSYTQTATATHSSTSQSTDNNEWNFKNQYLKVNPAGICTKWLCVFPSKNSSEPGQCQIPNTVHTFSCQSANQKNDNSNAMCRTLGSIQRSADQQRAGTLDERNRQQSSREFYNLATEVLRHKQSGVVRQQSSRDFNNLVPEALIHYQSGVIVTGTADRAENSQEGNGSIADSCGKEHNNNNNNNIFGRRILKPGRYFSSNQNRPDKQTKESKSFFNESTKNQKF